MMFTEPVVCNYFTEYLMRELHRNKLMLFFFTKNVFSLNTNPQVASLTEVSTQQKNIFNNIFLRHSYSTDINSVSARILQVQVQRSIHPSIHFLRPACSSAQGQGGQLIFLATVAT